MARLLTIGIVSVFAGLFGWGVPLARLFSAFQPLTVALSIMVAAVFVRLSRGMPTLDWKDLDLKQRTRLTMAVVDLTREYITVIAIDVAFLAGIITLTVIGKDDLQAALPSWAQYASAGGVGALGSLSVCRMAYVIWRDLDIVRLQKHLIDNSAAQNSVVTEINSAAAKVADIRAADLRRLGRDEFKSWESQ